jgi:predicted MarR family transcription regulator
MAIMKNSLFSVFADNVTRNVFDVIVSERSVNYRELCKSLDERSLHVAERDTSESLQKLQAANLIEANQAPVKDFVTYFVTATGLTAERELRKII